MAYHGSNENFSGKGEERGPISNHKSHEPADAGGDMRT